MENLEPEVVEALRRHGVSIFDANLGPWIGVGPNYGVGIRFDPFAKIDLETVTLLSTIRRPRLVRISFEKAALTADISPLRDAEELRALTLAGTDFEGQGAALAELRHLRLLNLFGARICDTDLIGIGRCVALEQLFLGKTSVTHIGLRELARCESLRYLDLEVNEITDDVLRSVSLLHDLEGLNIAGNLDRVSDDGVQSLLGLRHLRLLGFLPPESISPTVVKRLEQIPYINLVRGGCAWLFRPKDERTYFAGGIRAFRIEREP